VRTITAMAHHPYRIKKFPMMQALKPIFLDFIFEHLDSLKFFHLVGSSTFSTKFFVPVGG
jgi:hypothetical protein